MRISKDIVKNIFLDILEGRTTREAADRWAYSLIRVSEDQEIVYDPPEEKDKIWSSIMYLYGIDEKIGPHEEYLFSEEDVRTALETLLEDKKK